MEYGNRIKEIRNSFGESQKIFGERFNITSVQVSLLESEQRDIKIDFISKLESFGINIEWLITGQGEMFRNGGESEVFDRYGYDLSINSEDENLINRIKDIREKLELTQTEFAEQLDVSKSYISLIETGKQEPSRGILKKIESLQKSIKGEDLGIIRIPLLDVKASAGVGVLNYDQNVKTWIGIPDIFIYPHNPQHVALLLVDGFSMEPAIRHGDLLLVSENATELISDKVYILRTAEELRVKRLVRTMSGNIVIWSDNESFGKEELMPQEWEESGIQIVARVIKVIKDV